MKIVHINLSDNSGGGSLAALRLHTAMMNAGLDSKYIVFKKNIFDRNDVIEIKPNKIIRYLRLLRRVIFNSIGPLFTGKLNGKIGWFDFCNGSEDILKCAELLESDVIYIHCVQGQCFNYKALEKLFARNKKVFWFLHDNFAVTGGCLHPFDCKKYLEKCCNCWYWEGKIIFDCAENEFNNKNNIINKADNLAFIAPSFWIMNNAQKSTIGKNKKVYHIPNMVNPQIYKVIDKNIARELFSIDKNKKIVCFGAGHALTNPYKGWEYMKSALNILAEKNKGNEEIEILIFGCSYQKEVAESLPFKTHFLGFLSDEYSMAMMYNAIDVFVMPSLAENFPQTILESLACNVPVVAFYIGGIPDMVNEKSGYLAKYKDADDLAKGIDLILSESEKRDVRQFAEKYFTDLILSQHIEILGS